eukprot:707542-Ditylum_brightwellii.AAC.1
MRNIRKTQNSIGSRQHHNFLLSVTPTDMANNVVSLIKRKFTKDGVIIVHISIYASKVAQLNQIDTQHENIEGGAEPDYLIELPNSGKELNAMLDSFHEKTNKEVSVRN